MEGLKEEWIKQGEQLSVESMDALVNVLTFAEKGLDVFGDNLAKNTPTCPMELEKMVLEVFNE